MLSGMPMNEFDFLSIIHGHILYFQCFCQDILLVFDIYHRPLFSFYSVVTDCPCKETGKLLKIAGVTPTLEVSKQ
jgi:hypothetical protein